MTRFVFASALFCTLLAGPSCRRTPTDVNAQPNRDEGPPPPAAPCSQTSSFCVGVAPGGSTWVADGSGHWSPVRPTELRNQAATFATSHSTESHGYIVYWASARQPSSVENSLRNAGMQSISFVPVAQ